MNQEVRNLTAVKRIYELFFSTRDFAAIAAEFFADDYVLDIPESLPYGGHYVGAAGFLEVLPRIMQTWPDINYSVRQIAAGDDRVSVWLDCTGSHFRTGRSWAMPFIEEFRFGADGKLSAQRVFYYDTAALAKAAGAN